MENYTPTSLVQKSSSTKDSGPDIQSSNSHLFVTPYENFLKKHLQYYGFCTGISRTFNDNYMTVEEWNQNNIYLTGDTCTSKIPLPLPGSHLSAVSELDVSSSNIWNSRKDSSIKQDTVKDKRETCIVNSIGDACRTNQIFFSVREGRMVPQLTQPRGPAIIGFEPGIQNLPRWPAEMQVVEERIRHIPNSLNEKEPYYVSTGLEPQPFVVGEAKGQFLQSKIGHPSSLDEVAVTPQDSDDVTLVFESRFESGNLEKAIQLSQFCYELYLRPDLYSERHSQWFYFCVSNTRSNVTYHFSIVNFRKPYSLYSCGMQPLRYSEKMAQSQKVGWHRVGKDISYFKNNLINGDGATMYSLTFSFEFPYDYDRVFFAFCFPYTYTDLMEYLSMIENEPMKRTLCKQRLLCRTLAGNLVPLLTVTSRASDTGPVKEKKDKKVVIISARVHPGESNSSWIMKGLLDFILADSTKAELLRKQLIFKIVPMLNPDGVIVGNYRCSLTGRDLNRQYQSSIKEAFPTAWYLKNLITRMQRDHDVLLFCDIHGHSRKYNSFIYGCDSKKETTDQQHIFPFLMQKWASDLFSLSCCWYKVQRIKEGTARIAMWRLGVTNSYTLEASLAGSSKGDLAGYHFTAFDYEAIGHHFCEALLEYCTIDGMKDLKAGVIGEKLQNADSSDCEESDSSEEDDLCLKVKKITLKSRGLSGKPKNEKGVNLKKIRKKTTQVTR